MTYHLVDMTSLDFYKDINVELSPFAGITNKLTIVVRLILCLFTNADCPVMEFKSVVIILYYNSWYKHMCFTLGVYIVNDRMHESLKNNAFWITQLDSVEDSNQ